MRKSFIKSLSTGLAVCNIYFLAAAGPAPDRFTVTGRGQGPDVVLIPGLASSAAVWDSTAKLLEGHYRLHLVQVAGFAGSPAGANAQGKVLQPTVDALDAYIKTNHLKSPAIIGHSMGGLMGMMLAAQHPEDVGKVMVVDSLPFFSVLMGATDATFAEGPAAAMRDGILNGSQDEYAKSEEQAMGTLVKSPEGRKLAVKWALASDKTVVARAMYDVMTTDFRGKLGQIKAPLTLLYPWDESSGMPQALVDGLYRGNFAPVPNKKIIRIDGSYHFIMFDQPEKFAAQVDAFVK